MAARWDSYQVQSLARGKLFINHWHSYRLLILLQFGLGYNRCPGEHLAEIEIFKICATIVRDYKIRQVNPQESWKWKAYFTVVPHSWPVYVERG